MPSNPGAVRKRKSSVKSPVPSRRPLQPGILRLTGIEKRLPWVKEGVFFLEYF